MKFKKEWLIAIIPILAVITLVIISFVMKDNGTTKKKKEEKPKEEIKDIVFTTKDNLLDFTTTSKYNFEKSEESDYDLYIKDDKSQLTMGVFTYDLNTLEENSAKEILNNQVAYFIKTRKDMKVFKEAITKNYEDKAITTIEYSGKSSESSECIYRFSCIEFINNPAYAVYITQIIVKSDYENNITAMQNILESAKLK